MIFVMIKSFNIEKFHKFKFQFLLAVQFSIDDMSEINENQALSPSINE